MIYAKKTFLNDSPNESGYIIGTVTTPKKPKDFDSHWSSMDAYLKIADCHEMINLDFTVNKPKHLKKRLKKLDLLIEQLNDFRDEMVKQGAYFIKHKKEKKDE